MKNHIRTLKDSKRSPQYAAVSVLVMAPVACTLGSYDETGSYDEARTRTDASVLRCDDVAFPHGEEYDLAVMNEIVSQQAEVAEVTGLKAVTTCAEARAVRDALDGLQKDEPEGSAVEEREQVDSGDLDEKIWRGVPTSRPHHVLLWNHCSGVFINSRAILTAAHCIPKNDDTLSGAGQTVRCKVKPASTGSWTVEDDCKLWRHKSYSFSGDGDNDIGIVELPAARAVSGVGMHIYTGDLERYERLDAAGYGVTSDGATDTGTLREDPDGDDVPADERTPKQIVSYAEQGVARMCNGDSGTPFVKYVNGYPAAVTVHSNSVKANGCGDGVNCCAKYKGRQEHTRLRAHTGWIQSRINNLCWQNGDLLRCW